MSNVKVKLSRSYSAHADEQFDEIELRTPKWSDYMDLGKPQEWQPAAGDADAMLLITHIDVIGKYAERLTVKPEGPGLLNMLDIRDALAVEDAVLGFFARSKPSAAAPTTSSSD